MTVQELIELNQMIGDLQITIRRGDGWLVDQLNIGAHRGHKPPFPTKVPKDARYIGTMCVGNQKEALYIPKSINAKDDGKNYYEIKASRIPKVWRELRVTSWSSSRAFRRINNHELECIWIDAAYAGEQVDTRATEEEKHKQESMDGQMDIMDMLGGD